MEVYSVRYDAALALAAHAHRTQLRKGTDIPYIVHAVYVSVLLIHYGFDEDLAIAGLLHDVVEDCGLPMEQIAQSFGARVATIVYHLSEPQAPTGSALSWEQAKAAKLDLLRAGGPDVAAVKAADALHNTQATLRDLRELGPVVWERFKRGPEATLGYYQQIAALVNSILHGHALAAELAQSVAALADAIEAAASAT